MNNLTDLEAMQIVLKEFRQISKRNRDIILNMLRDEHVQIGEAVDDPYTAIKKEFFAAGGRTNDSNNFIWAIKKVREVGRIGLKEAKELVEKW